MKNVRTHNPQQIPEETVKFRWEILFLTKLSNVEYL